MSVFLRSRLGSNQQFMHQMRLRMLALVMIFTTLASFSSFSFSAGGVTAKELYLAATWDSEDVSDVSEPPDWDTLVNASEATTDQVKEFSSDQYKRYQYAVRLYNMFGTKSAYDKAVKKLIDYGIEYEAETDSLVSSNKTTKGEQDLARAVDSFNSAMGSTVAEGTISGIFDTDNFNPSAGMAAGFLDSFYNVINTIFYVASNFVIWWFLGQTSLDMVYLMCEPLQPFIGPKNDPNAFKGLDTNNAGSVVKSANFALGCLHLCSTEASTAYNGGGPGGNGNAGGSNKFVTYGKLRFPVLIACGVYLVLVSSGWWPKIISWVAGWATRGLSVIVGI